MNQDSNEILRFFVTHRLYEAQNIVNHVLIETQRQIVNLNYHEIQGYIVETILSLKFKEES